MSQKGLRNEGKTSLGNLMSIIGRINLVFLNLTHIVAARLNHATKLCKTIHSDLIQVKQLNRPAAGLNHLAELN